MTHPVAQARMLIRRPASDVFDAFVEPRRLTQFWLSRATGPLHAGARVEWEFMVPGAVEGVAVTAFEAPSHLAFTWTNGRLDVDMTFTASSADTTIVQVEVRGFEAGPGRMAQMVNATEGFAIVLCDLKTLLETGRSANLVRDKAALIEAGQSGPRQA